MSLPWESKDPGGCSFGPGSISGKGIECVHRFFISRLVSMGLQVSAEMGYVRLFIIASLSFAIGRVKS